MRHSWAIPEEVLAGTAPGSIAGSMGGVTPHLCTKPCNKREDRETHMVLSSDSAWMQTGLFGHQFLTEKSHLHTFPFVSAQISIHLPSPFVPFIPNPFTPNQNLILGLGHSSHSSSAFCLITRLSHLFHFPFTFPKEG